MVSDTGCPTAAGFGVTAIVVVVTAPAGPAYAVWKAHADRLPLNTASPVYVALNACMPAARGTVSVATRYVPIVPTTPDPISVESLKKSTVPEGTPVPVAGLTIAYNVTGAPEALGVGDTTSVVAVDAERAATEWTTTSELAGENVASPVYAALR